MMMTMIGANAHRPPNAGPILGCLAFACAAMLSQPLLGQGLSDPKTVDTIVDAPVSAAEHRLDEERQRIAEAIDASRRNAAEIRKLTNVGKVEIVIVPDLAAEGSPLAGRIDAARAAIGELRQAIEGSAIFFHAIDSHGVLLRDVIAVEMEKGGAVTVFAAGKPR